MVGGLSLSAKSIGVENGSISSALEKRNNEKRLFAC